MFMLLKEVADERLVVNERLIELGALTLAANKQLRSDAADLRVQANATRCRARRFWPMSGSSDASDGNCVRVLLRDFCSSVDAPKSFVGPSRGSICQACGGVIDPGEIEYDVVAGTSELRLDDACYKLFLEESDAGRQRAS